MTLKPHYQLPSESYTPQCVAVSAMTITSVVHYPVQLYYLLGTTKLILSVKYTA